MPKPVSRRGNRLGFVRTTAFKLSAIYIAIFTVFATFLIAYIGFNSGRILTQQVSLAVTEELDLLAAQYRQGGIRRLMNTINRRADRPGASLYLLTARDGAYIGGNVASVPDEVLSEPDPQLRPVRYQRLDDEGTTAEHAALVRVFKLPRGFTLLVGRDISERDRFATVIRQSLILTFALMIILGLISWIFVSRRVLKRIDSVAETSRQIMTGDLTGRLEVTGTGDEFDRLAYSLNGMLDRIERLMAGLKEVSDNIAHDLKTPLTRMRNRVEDTLASARNEPDYREALQATIDDSDQLIRTFDALLMIARVEAGSSTAVFEKVDMATVARDVAELYEPVAEEENVGLSLKLDESELAVSGNRELLSQAIANLLDNAIKYSTGNSEKPAVTVSVRQEGDQLIVSVADNGPGVPLADRHHVKERFVRLEESRSRPGAGLGLSMVSAVAQLHNGQLNLSDNEPGLCAELQMPVYKKTYDRITTG